MITLLRAEQVDRDHKRWLKYWARTERGQDMLSDLIARGYELNWPPQISGAARNFDAVDDKISRAGDDSLLDVDDTDSVIVQALLRLDAVSNRIRAIAGKKNSSAAATAGYGLFMAANEVPSMRVSDGVDQLAVGAGALVAGTWITLTGILTANAAANDDVSLYKDTSLNAGPTNSTALGSLANTRPFRIGSNGNATPNDFWDGDIAYVRVWIKNAAAWTANEHLNRVESYNKLYLPADAQMVLQWVLWDAGSPTTANDYTENSLDGTYTGTTFVDDPKRVYVASDWPTKVHRSVEAAVSDFPRSLTSPRLVKPRATPAAYTISTLPIEAEGWGRLLSSERNSKVYPGNTQ